MQESREETRFVRLRSHDGLDAARTLGNDAYTSSSNSDNIFHHGSVPLVDGIEKTATDNANTETLVLEPTIVACECNGVNCTTTAKSAGDFFKICLRSSFLDIAQVSEVTLRLDDLIYQPVVDGTSNEITNVTLHGRLAVVTTMIVSAFFQDRNSSVLELEVDGQVSFYGGTRRYLVKRRRQRTSRFLAVQETPIAMFVTVCLLLLLLTIGIGFGILIGKGYICGNLFDQEKSVGKRNVFCGC